MSPSLADWLVTVAAAMHLLQLPSMNALRREYALEIACLAPFVRAVLVLFASGIVACVVGLASVLLVNHAEVLDVAVGRSLCTFLAAFWSLRGLAQWTLLSRVWPSRLRALHRFLGCFYFSLGAAYSAALCLTSSSQAVERSCAVCLAGVSLEA